MSVLCCVLSCAIGIMWQRNKENDKKSIQITPTISSDPYETQIRNMLSYGGSAEGQVKLDEN